MLAAFAPLSHLALGLAPRGVSLGMPLLPRRHPPLETPVLPRRLSFLHSGLWSQSQMPGVQTLPTCSLGGLGNS